jgi:hypothetical protein
MLTLYDLTPVTGMKAMDSHTTLVPILKRRANTRMFRAVLIGASIGLLAAAGTTWLLGPYSVAVFLIVGAVVATLVGVRTGDLNIRIWKRMWNRTRAHNGHPFRFFKPLATETQAPIHCVPSLVDVNGWGTRA